MLTSNREYSQGLGAGVRAGRLNGAVVLSDPASLGHSSKEVVYQRQGMISRIVLAGGTSWLTLGVESDIDYAPPVCGSIVGTITARDTGAPLGGVRVVAYGFDPSSTDYPVYRAHQATTAPDGSYAIGHLERGEYWLTFHDPSRIHATQSYPHAPGTGAHGDRVSVEVTPAAPTRVSEALDSAAQWRAQRVGRLAGPDRYATAVAVSRASYRSTKTAVLVSGTGFADAMSASALAGAYRATLLLTPPDSLPGPVVTEMRRLGVTRVFLVGGLSSISARVPAALQARGFRTVTRLSGADRYATSARVYRYLATASGLPSVAPAPFVVRGDVFPDAIAASAASFRQIRPILLVSPTAAPASVTGVFRDFRIRSVIVVGGASSVSSGVLAQLRAANGRGSLGVVRIQGADRYATAVNVARYWRRPYDFTAVACGTSFTDALAGGVLAGARGGALLLTPSGSLNASAAGMLRSNATTLEQVRILGGPVSVSAGTQSAVVSAVRR